MSQTHKSIIDKYTKDGITDWISISIYQKLSEQLIEKYKDKVNWAYISAYQKLSEQFIEKYKDKVNWANISIYQKLSENFIEKYKDKVYWSCISIHQKLSENFIEKYKDKVDWSCISEFQKLSENFIEKYKDKVNWTYISKYQKLSEQFIEKYKDKVDWANISIHQKLSEQFINDNKDKITLNKKSWLYASEDTKKQAIINCNLYECYDDYFIAYKSVKEDYSSVFNFQYVYEIGTEHESHADYNLDNENSFGLSAWTLDKAKKYYDKGKILKVKCYYNNIAALVHNNYKIRMNRIYVVEET